MSRRAVLFDLGGTLLVMRRDRIVSKIFSDAGYETTPGQVRSAYHQEEPAWLLAYGGKEASPAESVESYRALDSMVFRRIFPGRSEAEAFRVSHRVRDLWSEVQRTVPLELYPDARPTLERLRGEGYRLGLVSNAPPDVAGTVDSLGISGLLGTIIISGVVGVSKPNPEIFNIALRGLGVGAREAIHVGDLYDADVRGARNAGIEGILLDRDGIDDRTDCAKISSLEEVYDFLV